MDVGFWNKGFFPGGPELGGGADGGVFYVVFVGGDDELAVDEQAGDVVGSLVADGLGDAFLYVDFRRFAFDNGEGDTVDE